MQQVARMPSVPRAERVPTLPMSVAHSVNWAGGLVIEKKALVLKLRT